MNKNNNLKHNILIPNATSPRNPGDQAMLQVLLKLVKNVHPKSHITVHSVDPHLYVKSSISVRHTLYSWSVFQDKKFLIRCMNVSLLLLQYFFLRIGMRHIFLNKKLSSLLADYENAGLILFVGGGYLHAKRGLTQSLNLFMHVLLFKYAVLYKAKKIVGPISIGPFGYEWQEKIVMNELRKVTLLAIREKVSFRLIKKYKMKNSMQASDHALMIDSVARKSIKATKEKNVIGFTIRKWLDKKGQLQLEESIVLAIEQFVKKIDIAVLPIIQVDASLYGEDDIAITQKIVKALKKRKVKVLPIKKITSLEDALKTYASLDLLLGMRMHSNIFAATQGTPFVAIAYEYKTQGIAGELSMSKYCLPCESISSKDLYDLLIDVYTKRKAIAKNLLKTIQVIRRKELPIWQAYLSAKI